MAYLNGSEVLRSNLPAGTIGPTTLAEQAIDQDEEGRLIVASVDPCLLVEGANVVAVEVHQAAPTSSDIRFDLVLAAERAPGGGVPCGEVFRRGDTNGDGALDIADAIATLSYLFGSASVPSCRDAVDTNDDGAVDIADAIAELSYLFGASGPLPAPFGEYGTDPSGDGLDCPAYEPCGR